MHPENLNSESCELHSCALVPHLQPPQCQTIVPADTFPLTNLSGGSHTHGNLSPGLVCVQILGECSWLWAGHCSTEAPQIHQYKQQVKALDGEAIHRSWRMMFWCSWLTMKVNEELRALCCVPERHKHTTNPGSTGCSQEQSRISAECWKPWPKPHQVSQPCPSADSSAWHRRRVGEQWPCSQGRENYCTFSILDFLPSTWRP